jgi:quercetin dioxygenase-like cupin family protein
MVMYRNAASTPWTAAPPSLPRGIQISILSGDPAQPGPFTMRLKIPAGTVIAPHTHATAETVTVLSGAILHETGPVRVASQGTEIASGGFVFLPAQMPHSLWTAKLAAEIQVNGTGPFGLHYINASDDPSQRR